MSTSAGVPASAHTKLAELKEIVEQARWGLLDAAVVADELGEILAQGRAAAADTRGVLGPEPNHEDYVPTGDRDCGLRDDQA